MRVWKNKKHKAMKIEYAFLCHCGNVRSENQDNIILIADGNIKTGKNDIEIKGSGMSRKSVTCGVFDGMGGMSKGETASAIAVDVIKANEEKIESEENSIKTLFEKVNEEIDDYRTINRIADMGTTGVMAIVNDSEFVFGNIGDSRLYFFEKNKLTQVSIDHTLKHPYTGKRFLVQYLGMNSEYAIEPCLGKHSTIAGNEILLCSDGLTDCLSDKEIEEILCHSNEVEKQMQEFKDTVLKRDAKDNISIILCRWE